MVVEEYSDLLFKLISDHTELGIAIINTDGCFVYYNKAMGEIEGLDKEEMLGKHIFDIFPSSNLENSTIYKSMNTGKPIYDSLQTYINFKGKKIKSIVTNIPLIVDGVLEGVVEIVSDAERIKRIYESSYSLLEGEEDEEKSKAKRLKSAYYEFDDFITNNKHTIALLNHVKHMGIHGTNMLIFGETGTGKEIVAQAVHNYSKRRTKPFVAQNCAALPENLMESIMFGSVRGSFTGASDMSGLFEQAHGGTLLLDELNSLPPNLQAKLLRVLQEGRVKRIGSNSEKQVDVHVIATINEPPEKLMREGRLREDLFFRLSTMYIPIPALRDRPEDIDKLKDFFAIKFSEKLNIDIPTFSTEVENFFRNYEWRGNVRELMNVMEYAFMNLYEADEVEISHLPHYLQDRFRKEYLYKDMTGSSYSDYMDQNERMMILNALERNLWNVSRTARELNIKRQTLHNKINRLGLKRPKSR